MVSEWIAKFYPDAHYKTNVRIGSLHPRLGGKFLSESEQRMVGVFLVPVKEMLGVVKHFPSARFQEPDGILDQLEIPL